MRKYFYSMAAVVLAATMMTLTSCTKENDEPTPPPSPESKIERATISIVRAFSPELFDLCEITASYTDEKGKLHTETLTPSSATIKIDGKDYVAVVAGGEAMKLPATAEATVKFTLKSGIDEEKTYTGSYCYYENVSVYRANGELYRKYSTELYPSTYSVKGSEKIGRFIDMLNRHCEKTVVTVDTKGSINGDDPDFDDDPFDDDDF